MRRRRRRKRRRRIYSGTNAVNEEGEEEEEGLLKVNTVNAEDWGREGREKEKAGERM